MTDSTILSDPYIYVIDNVLTKDKCMEIIKKFDKDQDNQIQGVTGGGVMLSVKNSKDLMVTACENWQEEDKLFKKLINDYHQEYFNHLNDPNTSNFVSYVTGERYTYGPFYMEQDDLDIIDTGYQIQKTDPGNGYTWHNDFNLYRGGSTVRYLTFILYLNDVEEGWTQFYNGDQVSPRAGRLLFFPATWTYVHQGYPPKQTKYLMTGWMHTVQKTKAKEDGEN